MLSRSHQEWVNRYRECHTDTFHTGFASRHNISKIEQGLVGTVSFFFVFSLAAHAVSCEH